ncbi:AbrB/MazE/SpoVT family DNA-binding domain-containing protein [Methanothrix sp.]
MSARPMTLKLDEKGRIQLPADLRARLNMNPGDEFVIDATRDTILLKKMDLASIMKGVIEEAQKVDLDKLEQDIEEEGNRIARKKYKIFAGH